MSLTSGSHAVFLWQWSVVCNPSKDCVVSYGRSGDYPRFVAARTGDVAASCSCISGCPAETAAVGCRVKAGPLQRTAMERYRLAAARVDGWWGGQHITLAELYLGTNSACLLRLSCDTLGPSAAK